MPLTLSGNGGITYPDGSVNATRSVSTAGDTMTGNLTVSTASTNNVISTLAHGVQTALQSISNPSGRVGTISNHNTEIVSNNVPYIQVSPSGVNFIKFSPTQIASADANSLDDYEEGTFSITSTSSFGAITGTWTPATCTYIKIGRTVTITIFMNGSNFGFTTLNGFYRWTGIPFSGNGSGVFTTGSLASAVAFSLYATSAGDLWFYAPNNTSVTNGGHATITFNII
jgi:hypothetical protein